MATLKKATIKSYDAGGHRASVQIAGSLGVWLDGVPVATDVPAADVVAGRVCSVLFLDEGNPEDAVVLEVHGALPSGGGGATTFLALTDTPAAYSGNAGRFARVNATPDALEFFDLFATANSWSALQTFGAGVQLASGQAVKDSGGASRYTPAASSPHNTLSGETRIDGRVAILSAPSTSPDRMLRINPTLTGVTNWGGLDIFPVLTMSGAGYAATAIGGLATANVPAATTGSAITGLNFTTLANALGAGAAIGSLTATSVKNNLQAFGATPTLTITDLHGHRLLNPLLIAALGGTINVPSYYGIRLDPVPVSNAAITLGSTAAYGVYIGDLSGTSWATTPRLLHVGPATPYFRVDGGAAPGAQLTNAWADFGGVGLRQLQCGAANSGGAGFRQVIVPN